MALWLGMLWGVAPLPSWPNPISWHAHEMLFGFGGAAVAGFLTTSVPVWTGRPPLTGWRLGGLAGLWLAGRAAVFFAGSLPFPWIAIVLDASFLPALALAIGPSIVRSRSRRNFVFPLLLLVLALANVLTHCGAGLAGAGLRLGVGVLILLVVILGGRLIPLFTAAALKRAGAPGEIVRVPWADRAAAPLLAVFVAMDTLWPGSGPTGSLALLTAATLFMRSKGWSLSRSLRDPLLWSMHLAHLWIPVGLVALALSAFGVLIPRSLAVHALTVGGIGGMILAIMSRVALGHTGRPFRAPPGMAVAYASVFLAALARTLLPLVAPFETSSALVASGLFWGLGFGVFLAVYTPFLVAPRVDGKPG